ncbi:MAG: glycosyltransferase family 39 protein [Candidatus Omnitrophica bacterium]|nr:glycosyltransferase family 39 protein [Candidatus Omnitrophota bacterium]
MSFRKTLFPIIIFLLALSFRLGSGLSTYQKTILPGSDPELYLSSTNEVYSVLSKLPIFFRELLKGNLGSGQDVLSKYGIVAPITVFRTGLIQPLLYALLFILFGENNFFSIFIFQALLSSLTCVIVFLLGRRLFSFKVGIIAAFLCVIYLPFIEFASLLMQETIVTFLLVVTVYLLLRGLFDNSRVTLFLSGISLFLLSTGRLAFMHLYIFLFLGLTLLFKFSKKKIVVPGKIILIFAGFLIPFLIWTYFSSLESHKFGTTLNNFSGPLSLVKSDLAMSMNNDVVGWFYFSDADRANLGPQLIAWLKNQGFSWGGQINPPNLICYKAFLGAVAKDIPGFVTLYLSKIANHWWNSTIFWWPDQANFLFDSFLRFLAFLLPVSLILSCYLTPLSIFLAIPILYLVLINSLIVLDPRYLLPIIPSLFIISIVTCFYLWELFCKLRHKNKNKTLLMLFTALCLYIVSQYLTVPILLIFFRKFRPFTAFLINLGIKNISVILFLFGLSILLSNLSKAKRIAVLISCSLCYLLIFNSWAYTDGIRFNRSWQEWFITLDKGKKVSQEIVIGRDKLIGAKRANLLIDLQQDFIPFGELIVSVNAQEVKRFNRKLPIDGKGYNFFAYDYVVKDSSLMRRWFSIPIDLSLLERGGNVKIELEHKPDVKTKAGVLKMYGDYPILDNQEYFVGPLFAKTDFETSIYNYLEKGDYRVSGKVKLASNGTKSSFYNGSSWVNDDLSDERGVQKGNYRIRVEVIDSNGLSSIF